MRSRRASLTALESGKVSATSGARRTVISWGAFRPGPRATTHSAWKSYSARSSSSIFRLDLFGITLSLLAGCLSGADDANDIGSLRVSHYQETPLLGLAQDNESGFFR